MSVNVKLDIMGLSIYSLREPPIFHRHGRTSTYPVPKVNLILVNMGRITAGVP